VDDIQVFPAGAVVPAQAESWDDPPAFLASGAVQAATVCRVEDARAESSGDPKVFRVAVAVTVAALVRAESAAAPARRIPAGLHFAATSARRWTP
jgi:hypothetical protein